MRVQPEVPQPPAPPTPISVADLARSGSSPADVLKAAQAARSELRNQLDRLQDQQRDLTNQLSDNELPAAARTGVEARLKEINARISAADQAVADADAAVAKATAVPGAKVPDPLPPRDNNEAEVVIPVVVTIFVLAPIALAYARRIWKRGAATPAPISREMTDRLEQLTQSVESIALEVERIGEGQRFVTKVLSDNGRALGAGAAQPIQVGQGERAAVPRQG